MTIARILSIAGSDSGGGAGIQADIRTISYLGAHAMTAITAITAQNTVSVYSIIPLAADFVLEQMDVIDQDIGIDAIKIGMLGNVDIAKAVAQRLLHIRNIPIIFDPVMVATSGTNLADDETIMVFAKLMQCATLVTPNLPEYDRLCENISADQFPCDVLVKGGHAEGDVLVDILMRSGKEIMRWEDERIDTKHNHGTGCTLSAAIATYMGQGLDVIEAIKKSRFYVRASLIAAPGLGDGNGPMGMPQDFIHNG